MLLINFCGFAMQLHASGAIYLPKSRDLLIADAHFGKAQSFRSLGVPVPQGTTASNLDQLDMLVAETAAKRIIFLGDFLHSAWAQGPVTQQSLADWRALNPQLQLTLVRGNHDDKAGDPPASLGMAVVDEPLFLKNQAQDCLALCHHPQLVAGAYVLAGHWHPCVSLYGSGRDRMRLPCFWFGEPQTHGCGVLPAFGSFTGMHPIDRCVGDRIFVVAGEVVRELPG
ncbi:MAG: ligase-associated DNA damage response endonuclease PdeM [Pseudomonadota bacterium]